MRSAALVRLVFLCEIKRLLRDRRALLLAVVLPTVAYPLLFLFSRNLESVGREALEAREVRIGADLRALAPGDREELTRLLAEPGRGIALSALELAGPPDAEGARALLEAREDDLLAVAAEGEAGDPPVLRLFHDDADEDSDEALRRVEDATDAVLLSARDAVLEQRAGRDPGRRYETLPVDVARPEDKAGMSLGGLLPILAVLVLISGGSLAALDAFAGERESGTIETLLVHPAPAAAVAWGKFLAVFATGLTAFLGNATSLFVCLVLEVGELPALPPELDWSRTALRLGRACLGFLPTAALASAVLALVAARARTFRQGQLLLTPLTFLALALAAPAAAPSTELGPVLALVPVTGAALALRDAAAGVSAPLLQLLAFLASVGWAGLALSRLASTLDAERLLASPDTSAEGAARRLSSARALRFGVAAALVLYIVGGRVQAAAPVGGLLATQWILALGLALVFAQGTLRSNDGGGGSLAQALGLRRPRAAHVLGALLCAPAVAIAVERLFQLQQKVLPLPASATEGGGLLDLVQDLPLPALLFVMAVSPAVCEELLFRGALLGAQRRDLRARAVILWQAVLFGAVHASVYRFLPTAVVGALLAALALRARSVVPGMLLHASYNGLLVTAAFAELGWLLDPWLALCAVPGVLLLFLVRAPRAAEAPRAA